MIIKYDTNRWTLVHESMHFLFHKWVVEEGFPDMKLEADANRAENEADTVFQAFKTSKSGKDFANFAQSLDKILKLTDRLIKRGPLEESAVEDTLAERFLKGLLTFVPAKDAYDNWYLLTNLKRASPFYSDQMTPQKDNLGKDVINLYWVKQKSVEAVAILDNQIAEVDGKISQVVLTSEEAQKELDQLNALKANLIAERAAYQKAADIASKSEELLSATLLEIRELAEKSIERKESAPSDLSPFMTLAKTSMGNVSFSGMNHTDEDKLTSGCAFNHSAIPTIRIRN